MLLYLILGVVAVLLLGIAAVAVGPDRFVTFWKWLPAIVRTWIQVALGAIATWLLTDGLTVITDLAIPSWAKALLVAVAGALTTSGVVAANPADTRYGAKVVVGEVVGSHEVAPGEGVDAGDTPPVA